MNEIIPSVPFRIEMEVINLCNRNPPCDYCYAYPFDGYVPSFEQVKFFIDKTKRQVHPFEVIFLGGEPFLRKDMIKILEYSAETFAVRKTSISSNGTVFKYMTSEQIQRLKRLADNGSVIQVSIDSATNPNTPKGIESLEGIGILDRNGVSFRAGIVLTQQNYGDYLNTINVLLDLQTLRGINLEPLQKINDEYFFKNTLTNEQMIGIKSSVLELRKAKQREDVTIVGLVEHAEGDLRNKLMTRTNRGIELVDPKIINAGLYANGDVSMNGTLGRAEIIGNLLSQDWKDIWHNARTLYRKSIKQENKKRGSDPTIDTNQNGKIPQ